MAIGLYPACPGVRPTGMPVPFLHGNDHRIRPWALEHETRAVGRNALSPPARPRRRAEDDAGKHRAGRRGRGRGTRVIVATPHVNATCTPRGRHPARARARGRRASAASRSSHRGPRAAPSWPITVRPASLTTELELIASGPPGRRWLLVEAPLAGIDPTFTTATDELRARGFAIVVAHPERSLIDRESGWRSLEHERAAGSAFQVNAWSVAGRYGDRVKHDAFRVLAAASTVTVASDAHGPERPPSLRLGMAALARPAIAIRFAAPARSRSGSSGTASSGARPWPPERCRPPLPPTICAKSTG